MTLLIFDCDGTLVETEMLHAEVEIDLLREYFNYQASREEHNRRFAGVGMEMVLHEVSREAGQPVAPELMEIIAKRKHQAFTGRVVPVPFITIVLDELKAMPRCVASNAEHSILQKVLAETGLLEAFAPNIFSASMVPRPKPAPDLFRHAADRMHASVQDCIVIEDSSHGVAAARAAGMRVLGFAGASHCGTGYVDRLRDADKVFTDMRKLPELISSLSS